MKKQTDIVKEGDGKPENSYWWRGREDTACKTADLKPGNMCQACRDGVLAYDTMCMLTCVRCGKTAESGAFT